MKAKPAILILSIGLIVLGLLAGGWYILDQRSQDQEAGTVSRSRTAKPKKPVNQIPVEQRPYVSLEPIRARNELMFTLHNLPREASKLEVVLEYDRNKGILDAILRQFSIHNTLPFQETLFMGSKSAGGHVTYHDDVIGGTLTLDFMGQTEADEYVLEVPWRYGDLEKEYDFLATSDAKFQVDFSESYKTPKYVIMQSPGLPKPLPDNLFVVSGPYLFRGLGSLPTSEVTVSFRGDTTDSSIYGYDETSDEWILLDTQIIETTAKATEKSYQVYVLAR